MSGYALCPRCHGQGRMFLHADEAGNAVTTDCSLCKGVGEVRADVAFEWLEEVGS